MDNNNLNAIFHHNNGIELIDDLTDHVHKLQLYDFSRIDNLIELFRSTGNLQELSLNNGCGDKSSEFF
ncbi:MAG: hypothetical protein ACFFBP_12845 [Promethearchaeota archaeon]